MANDVQVTKGDDEGPAFNPRPNLKATTTVTEALYHQLPDQQPHHAWHSWTRDLEGDDQACDRLMRGKRAVGEAWVKPDFGWNEDPGLVWVLNEGGEPLGRIPTPAQKAEEDGRILLVGIEDDAGQVIAVDELPPTFSARHLPVNGKRLRLRCRCGLTRVRVVSHPK